MSESVPSEQITAAARAMRDEVAAMQLDPASFASGSIDVFYERQAEAALVAARAAEPAPAIATCSACGIERTDYEGPHGAWLPTCPNCGSDTDPALPVDALVGALRGLLDKLDGRLLSTSGLGYAIRREREDGRAALRVWDGRGGRLMGNG